MPWCMHKPLRCGRCAHGRDDDGRRIRVDLIDGDIGVVTSPLDQSTRKPLFINGKFIGGAIPKPQFQQIIDEKLAIAEKSGVSGADYYEKEIMGKGVHQFRSKRDSAKRP